MMSSWCYAPIFLQTSVAILSKRIVGCQKSSRSSVARSLKVNLRTDGRFFSLFHAQNWICSILIFTWLFLDCPWISYGVKLRFFFALWVVFVGDNSSVKLIACWIYCNRKENNNTASFCFVSSFKKKNCCAHWGANGLHYPLLSVVSVLSTPGKKIFAI